MKKKDLKSQNLRIASLLLGGGALLAAIVFIERPKPVATKIESPHLSQKFVEARLPATDPASTKSVGRLKTFVVANAHSKDPAIQDGVASSRIRLAYADAYAGHFASARTTLLTAAREYKGTGVMNADYGTLPDQALYQAAVCLAAEGKKDQAKAELRDFLKERPKSALDTACYRRLVRLNGGKSDPNDERLLQTDITQQEKDVKFEASVCGPKNIAYLYPTIRPTATASPLGPQSATLQGSELDYRKVALLCGTTAEHGTTIDQMRKGLAKLGIQSFAFRMNRADFAKAPLPAIWLISDHYVSLLEVKPDRATVYDSRLNRETFVSLPKVDDAGFTADLILFSQPEVNP